ncbi:hypothetical protein MX629_04000 [Carnobacterium divergens]|uniref:Phage protein n=1 Tax=Carnobacterium divergens TaxID=2748 RepID=A0AAW8R9W7_CARDV|nr:hypothetical protein [Carnobacterium divergens]MDT1957584.1 hypothetical protein [Carnobacterium divergens]MDT1973787.1 hypothetical protein [Carnobacterium divergens]
MSKKLNRFQKRSINEFINDQEKDLDEMQQHIYDMIILYRLTNEEVGSLLTSVMLRVMSNDKNKPKLEEMGITKFNLSVDVVSEIQKILTKSYVDKLDADGKVKKK